MRKFDIGGLLMSQHGSIDTYDFSETLELDPESDLKLLQPVVFELTVIKMRHEISVHMQNVKTVAEGRCARCLDSIKLNIEIPEATRQFLVDLPEHQYDEDEHPLFVDKKHNTIDLYTPLCEEILLHFPSIPLCSVGCKGLCQRCGANLNKKDCNCDSSSLVSESPFNKLK